MGWVGSGHTKWTHGQLCASARLATVLRLSVCLCIPPSVTSRYSIETYERLELFWGKSLFDRCVIRKFAYLKNMGGYSLLGVRQGGVRQSYNHRATCELFTMHVVRTTAV